MRRILKFLALISLFLAPAARAQETPLHEAFVGASYAREDLTNIKHLVISAATSGFRVVGASEDGQKPQENPKLSTPLVLLSLSVKQESARPAVAGAISPPAGFSTHSLPKPLRDAVRARRMRITNNGEVQVYIELSSTASQNLEELRSLGVVIQIVGQPKPDKSRSEVLTTVPTVQGLLPVTMINQVSTLPFVRFIRLPDYGFKSSGSVDSQGDQVLRAAQARNQFGVDGTGIRIGVISDGIGGIFDTNNCTTCGATTLTPSPITLGDLPNATGTRNASGTLTSVSGGIVAQSFPASTPDLEGPGAEGTAMLEIVHDLAPGAQLYFANPADGTSMSFEQAVDYITANTNVGVDDLSFFVSDSLTTYPFDGTSAVSSNTAADLNADTNPIRGYFTAVGNEVFDHWGEPYTDSGRNLTLSCPASQGGISRSGNVQLFRATADTRDAANMGPLVANPLTLPDGATVVVFLRWNDSSSGSSNNYDLFLYQIQAGNLAAPLSCSVDPQTGTQPPAEQLVYSNNSGGTQQVGILVQNVNNAAAARNFDMFLRFFDGSGNFQNLNFYTPSGSVLAEADAGGTPVSVVSVGAVDQTQCSGPGNCTGSVEPYSSQGPTAATPQATARMKPDVTATDGVSITGAGGFGSAGGTVNSPGCPSGNPSPPGCYFFGTSAAAPHAAAIAALVLQALSSSSAGESPATARTNLRNFLTSTAVPLPGVSQPVPNNIEGFGLLDALSAVKAAVATLPPTFIVSPNPATVDIAVHGQSGTSAITVTGINGFTGAVKLTCTVSPIPVNFPPTCFVFPPAVALTAATSSATATLRISVVPRLSSGFKPENGPKKPGWFAVTAGLALSCIFLLGVASQRRRWAPLLGLIALVFVGVTLSGCASGGFGGKSWQINFGTPSGSYTVTVAASSGGRTLTTSVFLTVQ